MELAIFILFIAISVISRSGKKQEQREKARRKRSSAAFEQAEQMELPLEGSYRPGSVMGEETSGREPNLERQRRLKEELRRKHGSNAAAASQPPASREGHSRTAAAVTGAYSDEYLGSMLYDTAEGEGHIDGDYRVEELTPRSDDHVVRAFTESAHSHRESSITGVEDCHVEPEPDSYSIRVTRAAALPELKADTLRAAVLYSEMLGKPKALRGAGR